MESIQNSETLLEAQMVNRIIEWSNINSGSYNTTGLERMSEVLKKAFSELQCESEVIRLSPVEHLEDSGEVKKINLGPCLRFWKRPDAPFKVLLMGHMDTVYSPEHHFQVARFKTDKILNGPGVTDMKGGICVMLEALKAFEAGPHQQALGWEVIINPDEEIGSLGSRLVIADRAPHYQVGLLFEPAMDEQGTLAGERKGTGNFTVAVRGRAAHAGRDFHAGRNAIISLAKIIQGIEKLNGMRAGVTLNVGIVKGGDATNVVPAFALARIDVRTISSEDETWILENLQALISEVNQQEGIQAELRGFFTRKPKAIIGKTLKLYEMVQSVAHALGQTLNIKPSGGCCDGNNLSEAGVPNVDTLGVCGGNIHSENEYLRVDSLIPRTQLVTAILNKLAVEQL